MSTLTPTRRTLLIALGLALATVAVYWPVWWGQFLSIDDHAYVSDNAVVQQGLSWNGVVWAFTGAHVANYHPLTWLSHMLDCQLFGPDPRWHHAINLLFHIANSVLLFLVLKQITSRQWTSAFVAGVFALHPQHVESVAWVAERKDVLSGLFWILTLAAYASYVRRPGGVRYGLALALFALGLLSKPMVVTLPCVLLLLDVWPLGRTRWFAAEKPKPTDPTPAGAEPAADAAAARHPSPWFLIAEKIPFLALSVGSSVATVLAQSAGGAVASMEQMSLGFRVGNALVSYARYARKFLLPHDLAAFYPLTGPWPLASVLAAVASLLIVTAVALMFSRKRPYLAVGWLYFLGTLVPVIGLVQVGNQSMADRYMYLPMIGLAVMLAWLWRDAILPRVGPQVTACAAGAALLACAGLTSVDVRAWRDSETLFTRAIQRTEPNVFALHNLGSALLMKGETDRALVHFEHCAKLQPSNPHVRRAYGFALKEAKRFDDALQQFELSLRLSPNESRTWNAVGHTFADQKQWDAAAHHFATAVQLNRDDYDSLMNLAAAHNHSGRHQAAMETLGRAVKLAPQDPRPWMLLGSLLVEANRSADAIEPFSRAAALDAKSAAARYQLGAALMSAGRGAEAVGPLLAAAQLAPGSPEPLARLAWLLSTHPDGALRRGGDALFLAERAKSMAPAPTAETLVALAAALAEQQQFDAAARAADAAAELARKSGNATLATTIDSHAARYRRHEAMRDTTLVGADAGEAIP